jgi:alpha-tubulin suppressor-like RCC1 family protein
LGDFSNRLIPILIPILNITQISLGRYHSIVLNNISQVYTFGYNDVINIKN